MTEPTAAAIWVHVDSLQPWDRNPVIHDDEQVADLEALIAATVWTAPIVARTSDHRVIAGHGRRLAALRAIAADAAWRLADAPAPGMVPVRLVDVDDATATRLTLADNALTKAAPWDDSELADLLRALGDDAVGIGFDADDLAALLDEPVERPAATDDVPDVQAEVHSKPGEVYELGPHRLVCGDCRDADTVARLLNGRKINIAFTSPPYASQRTYDESSGFKPIPPDEFSTWFEAVQANVRANLAPDGSWFVNIKEHSEDGQRSLYVKDLTINHVRKWGWRFVDEFCWLRQSLPGDPNSMRKFKNGFEPVFHFTSAAEFKFRPDDVRHRSAHAFSYKDQKKAGRDISSSSQGKGGNAQSPVGQGEGVAYPSNVLEVKQGANVVGHSAAFPVEFPSFFVRAFTDEADTVYDPFMGSGTTLMAAAQTKRVAFGCEISPMYCDLIRRRWTRYAKEAGIDAGSGALDG
jgi:DNA modification methylase